MKRYLIISVAFLIIAPLFSLAVNIKTVVAGSGTQAVGSACGKTCVNVWSISYCSNRNNSACIVGTSNICGNANWTDDCVPTATCDSTTKKCVTSPPRLDPWGAYSNNNVTVNSLAGNTGLGVKDPREVIANVVNIILGFLGIIAVILILVGGFMWMTAAGNEEKTGTAKKIMAAGAVGLVIVLAAFGIAKFVISALITATT